MRSCKRRRGGSPTSRVFAVLMAIVLCVGYIPFVPTVAYADTLVGGEALFGATAEPGGTVTGGDTISENGTYTLLDTLAGRITIKEGLDVTLVGAGSQASDPNPDVSLECESGVHLTIENLKIAQGSSSASKAFSVINFTNGDNTLTIKGENLLEKDTGATGKAMIHVPTDASLLVNGDGVLYFYKSEQGAGFGGDGEEMNGAITFGDANNGSPDLRIFGKGSKQGAVVGAGANASGTGNPGDITFNSGTFTLIAVARGALIGGSAGAGGASAGGKFVINGGSLNLNVDWTGAAIGGGGYAEGNDSSGGYVFVNGGSIRSFVDTNAVSKWAGVENPGVTDKVITALKTNDALGTVDPSTGSDYTVSPLAVLPIDTSQLSTPATGATSFAVAIDGESYNVAGLHLYRYVNENTEKDGQAEITDTRTNWVFNTSDGTAAGTPNDPNLYLYASKFTAEGTPATHKVVVNGDKFTATWDEATSAFIVAAVPDPAETYDWDSTTWAGGLDFTWYDAENPQAEYHLTTPAQWEALAWICSEDLAKLADYEENTKGNVTAIRGTVPTAQNKFEGVKFYLDNDIDMGGVYDAETDTWSGYNYYPIGSQAQNDLANGQFYGLFYGSFDGQGHYVNNIYCERGTDQSSQSVGLFGRVGAADNTQYPAVDITIENVGVSGFIKSGRSVGGIVGKTLHVASGNHVYIKSCVNRATVRSSQKKGVGGIVGAFWNGPIMENCYSLGTAGGGTPLGSIVGGNEGTITNVYSTQPVAVSGEKATTTASVNNAYQLEPGTGSQPGTNKTEDEMKATAFVMELNGEGSAFNADTDNLNGGFPCLAWEGGTPVSADDMQAIDSVTDAVAAIGEEVTVDSKEAIEAAQAAYEALTDEQKALLPTEVQTAYDSALASYTGALVGAIPSDATTEAGIVAVNEAVAAYNGLSDDQKALVPAASVATLVRAQQSAANALVEQANAKASAAEQESASAATAAAAAQAQVTQLKKDLKTAQAAQGLKANPMTVTAKAAKAKAKKKTVIKKAKAFNVQNAKGKVTFAKISGNAKITVSKAGKVTVKKGLKKGKTFKVKVLVCAAGDSSYAPAVKTVTLKVKIK